MSHQGSLPIPRSSFIEVTGTVESHTTHNNPSTVKAEMTQSAFPVVFNQV
jgi:hypothetical protein